MASEENHLLSVSEVHTDQLIILFEIDRNDAARARIGEFVERSLFHGAVARREEDVGALLLEICRRDYRGQVLVLLEFHKAGNRLATCGGCSFGNLIDLEPVHAALRTEQ